jgi:uncharacterized membrane protein YqaE (UPF0057 family)
MIFDLIEIILAFFTSNLAIFGQSGPGKILISINFCFILTETVHNLVENLVNP